MCPQLWAAILLQFLRREQRVIRCAKPQEVRGQIRRCSKMHCEGKWFGAFSCVWLSSEESPDTYQRRFTDLRETPHCFIHPQVCRTIYKRHCIDWLTQDWLLLWDPARRQCFVSPPTPVHDSFKMQTQCLSWFISFSIFSSLLSAGKPARWLVNTCMEPYIQSSMRIHTKYSMLQLSLVSSMLEIS